MVRRIALATLLVAGTSNAAPPVSLQCGAAGAANTYPVPASGAEARFVWRSSEPAWLAIEERGQRLSIGGVAPQSVLTIGSPLRYGWHWLPLERSAEILVAQAEKRRLGSTVAVTVTCAATPGPFNLEWIRRASVLYATLAVPAKADAVDAAIGEAQSVLQVADTPVARAIGLHLLAQAFTVNARDRDAAPAFAAALQAWSEIGDTRRALVARVAQIESVRRTGSYAAVIDLTADSPATLAKRGYWGVRLENSRCMAQRYLGEIDAAEKCFLWTLPRLRELDERLEFAETLQNYAGLEFARGDLKRAKQVIDEALPIATTLDDASARGRVHYMAAALAQRRFSVIEFLGQANAALMDFEKAGWLNWQANVLLDIASEYAMLEAHAEAYAALGDAIKRMEGGDHPAEMATAMLTYAGLEDASGRRLSASIWGGAARMVFAHLEMPLEEEAARLFTDRILLRGGSLSEAELEQSKPTVRQQLYVGRWQILSIEFALRKGNLDAAREMLDEAARGAISFRERILLAGLEAQYWRARGDFARAQRILFETASQTRALTRRIADPVLRHLLARRLRQQRGAGLETLLEFRRTGSGSATADIADETTWTWLLVNEVDLPPPKKMRDNSAIEAARKFDEAVARQLLDSGTRLKPDTPTLQHELFSLLATSTEEGSSTDSTRTISLRNLQSSMPPNAALIAYLEGEEHGGLMWVSSDHVSIFDAASPAELRKSIGFLASSVHSRDTSIETVDAASAIVSAQLLGNVSQPAPQHLYVLANSLTNAIPWSLLRWPREQHLLVETTSVETIAGLPRGRAVRTRAAGAVRILVADQHGAEGSTLPELRNAVPESEAITKVVEAHGLKVIEDLEPDRRRLLLALGESGGWLHVVAHGMARPDHVGQAGIWLAPRAGGPEFLTWLDVLVGGARADLVVLDACQTGDGGLPGNDNLSFAFAVAEAGAADVVAAAWPVSDSASARWPPLFYDALLGAARGNVAEALRTAQMGLRETRRFRHPFFWAGFESITSVVGTRE